MEAAASSVAYSQPNPYLDFDWDASFGLLGSGDGFFQSIGVGSFAGLPTAAGATASSSGGGGGGDDWLYGLDGCSTNTTTATTTSCIPVLAAAQGQDVGLLGGGELEKWTVPSLASSAHDTPVLGTDMPAGDLDVQSDSFPPMSPPPGSSSASSTHGGQQQQLDSQGGGSSSSNNINNKRRSPVDDDIDPVTALKRQRNNVAARKYRQKRIDRINELEAELQEVKDERDDLRIRLARQEAEAAALRSMLQMNNPRASSNAEGSGQRQS
ncbi:hypothetical protein F5X96DRAFT_665018 [Biscogniauxia mediterranea]|nr:hypothetical protein F5X96DRAFT_665018 [Biscogniauxia mediterranea]